MERLIDEEEDMNFETKPKLFSIDTIILLKEIVSLLSVRVLEIRSIEETNLEQGTLYQTTAKVVPSTMKSKNFYVRPKVSLEDKVYPETYYYHSHDDIQVDETPSKIQVQNL